MEIKEYFFRLGAKYFYQAMIVKLNPSQKNELTDIFNDAKMNIDHLVDLGFLGTHQVDQLNEYDEI